MSQEPEELGFELPPPANASRGRVLVVVVLLVAGAFAFAWTQRRKPHGEADAAAGGDGGAVHVQIVQPKTLDSNEGLVLPGVVKPLEEARIYPRTAGYVKRWLVDIGDKVTAGQLLAEIEAPDVDAQLAQARAQLAQAEAALAQAKAQRDYSKANADRNVTMAQQSLIAKATLEQAVSQAKVDEATVAADEANIAAAEANVKRLSDLVNFQKVTAPFAGTITSRSIDRGNLVGDATSATATPMFTLVATDPVRVFVDTPQTLAPTVQRGTDAVVTAREFGNRKFPGKITRAADALDPDLHVMTTEIDVPNPDGTLLPGMYVQAQLTLAVPHRVYEIPATALYADSQGVRVATVDAHDKAHFVKIGIERDTGATLWVSTGLTGDEKLVKVAVPTLGEGDPVEIEASK